MKIKRFIYLAEKGNINFIDSVSAEMAYRSICYFYMPYTKIIVIDTETNKASIFTRKLDENGNLISIFNELEEN